MKTQIWIAVSGYVLVAIVKKRLDLDASLYTLLQIRLIGDPLRENAHTSSTCGRRKQMQRFANKPSQLNLLGDTVNRTLETVYNSLCYTMRDERRERATVPKTPNPKAPSEQGDVSASLGTPPFPRHVKVKPSSYQPSKAELEAGRSVEATPEALEEAWPPLHGWSRTKTGSGANPLDL